MNMHRNRDKIYIIVRSCGERTVEKCLDLCQKQGQTDHIEAVPFGENLRQSYQKAIESDAFWCCMIDADVFLHPGVLQQAITDLNSRTANGDENIFCLDGFVRDKVMQKNRRAGIHIYRIDLLPLAMQYINDDELKPESFVRKAMSAEHGFRTYSNCKIVFGLHDYEQYYSDLWRKAVCQVRKLPKRAINMAASWKILANRDDDFKVIYSAHKYGLREEPTIKIDKTVDYQAAENLAALGITEKGPLGIDKVRCEGVII